MWLLIREASLARNLRSARAARRASSGLRRIAFCTDDRDPERHRRRRPHQRDGARGGRVRRRARGRARDGDASTRRAWHGLDHLGAVAPGLPGRPARPARPRVASGRSSCSRRGRPVGEIVPARRARVGAAVGADRAARARRLRGRRRAAAAIARDRPRAGPGRHGVARRACRRVVDGFAVADPERDLAKIAVIERHLGDRPRRPRVRPRLRVCSRGALASTVAHDAHNLVVRRRLDDDMLARRARASSSIGGGIVAVDGRQRARGAARCPSPACSPTRRSTTVIAAEPRAAPARRRALGWRGRDAVPDDVVPRALGDPRAEDHRPRARRRRAVPSSCRCAPSEPAAPQRARRRDGRRRARSTPTAGCSSRTAASRRSAAARRRTRTERVDLGGAVVTPGLVNTHHHLYQTLTRARAQEADLFTWLRDALSRSGPASTPSPVYAAARTGLAELALSGCTTVFDHHYVFPRGTSGLIGGRGAGGARARRAHRRVARLDGSRRVATAASRPTRSSRRSTTILADTERLAGLAGRRTAACRSRSRRARRSR